MHIHIHTHIHYKHTVYTYAHAYPHTVLSVLTVFDFSPPVFCVTCVLCVTGCLCIVRFASFSCQVICVQSWFVLSLISPLFLDFSPTACSLSLCRLPVLLPGIQFYVNKARFLFLQPARPLWTTKTEHQKGWSSFFNLQGSNLRVFFFQPLKPLCVCQVTGKCHTLTSLFHYCRCIIYI